MDIRLALMAGTDIPIPELQLTMHQPRIIEIAMMGEADFFGAAQYACVKKEQLVEDKSLLSSLTNFQVLLKVLQRKDGSVTKSAMVTLFSLLFPSHQTIFTPQSILLRNRESGETQILDGSNFDILQSYLEQVLCLKSLFQGDNITYNPANAAAKKIADKIMAGRRKVAELRNKEQHDSILGRYISILCVGLPSMGLEDYLNMTLYQIFDLMERYNLWFEWDLDVRQRLAGGTPKEQAENWMKSIH